MVGTLQELYLPNLGLGVGKEADLVRIGLLLVYVLSYWGY